MHVLSVREWAGGRSVNIVVREITHRYIMILLISHDLLPYMMGMMKKMTTINVNMENNPNVMRYPVDREH